MMKCEERPNTIYYGGAPVRLSGWQIAKDSDPNNSITLPPDSVWRGLNSYPDKAIFSEGNWLLRTTLFISDSVSDNVLLGIFPQYFLNAYEIYWDGKKIAENGTLGANSEKEASGVFRFSRALPRTYCEYGTHIVVLRISNHSDYSPWKWYYGAFVVGDYEYLLNRLYSRGYQAFFISGILFIALLFNLFLFFNRRGRAEHFLLGLICFLLMADYLITQAPQLLVLPTTYAHFEYYFYNVVSLLLAVLFPAFFIYIFSFPRLLVWVIVLINAVIYFTLTDISNVFNAIALTVLILSSILVIWALIKKSDGSAAIFTGILFAWAAYFFDFALPGLATIMVIGTSFSIARQFARTEITEKEAQLKSARLENELLKKNINPHFVLNTLTSIIVWLRKDVSSAIKLIEALAEEFRTINQVSSQKLIPLEQEIALCRAHLRIMSFRRGADFRMDIHGAEENEMIPPMIFHTLVENGLTHGYEKRTEGTFTLTRTALKEAVKFVLSNDGDFTSEEQKGSSGFGFRYIQSRLEESYPGRWSFVSRRLDKGWESVIEIRDK